MSRNDDALWQRYFRAADEPEFWSFERIEQMSTTARETDERWPTIVQTLVDRGLDRHNAEIAADYVIECLDLQEKYFESEREPGA